MTRMVAQRGDKGWTPFRLVFKCNFRRQLRRHMRSPAGGPCFAIDTTQSTAEVTAEIALDLLRQAGVPFEDVPGSAEAIRASPN